jgi:Zn-dependent peptidase ImmA (M78 family)
MKLTGEILGFVKDLATSEVYDDGALNFDKLCSKLDANVKDIVLAEFDDDAASGLLKKDGDGWVIYVNETDSVRRRRFTIAHEIGHLISFLKGGQSKIAIDQRGEIADFAFARSGNISNSIESEANAIAAELLMPEREVRSLRNQNKTVEEMADFFQVSEIAMSVRLQSIGIFPFELYGYGTKTAA